VPARPRPEAACWVDRVAAWLPKGCAQSKLGAWTAHPHTCASPAMEHVPACCTGVRGKGITLKLKRRQEGAPTPWKCLGHGPCDNLSRSVTLGAFTALVRVCACACMCVCASQSQDFDIHVQAWLFGFHYFVQVHGCSRQMRCTEIFDCLGACARVMEGGMHVQTWLFAFRFAV